jgi:hypothetical protein
LSANLINSNALAAAPWFVGLVRAALVEYALAHPNDRLSRSMVRDPGYLLPMFASVVADNPSISAATNDQKQNDVRYALASNWASLGDAIPNLEPQSARIPVLAADPPATSEVSIWVDSASGDLRIRDEAETIHTYPAGG